jgi:predicted ATP-dependent protease
MSFEVPISFLRRNCDPQKFDCNTSADMPATRTIIGQPRATQALRFGLGIKAQGFNIYVSGLPGTGRTTAVTRFLEEIASGSTPPLDWCYVNDFRDAARPHALGLPAGHGRQFQGDLKALVERVRRDVRAAFDGETYAARAEESAKGFQKRSAEIEARTGERARQAGFVLRPAHSGILTLPLKDNGQPLMQEEFMALGEADRDALEAKQQALQSELEAALRQIKGIEKEAEEARHQLDRQVALFAIDHLFGDLKQKYEAVPGIAAYLDALRDDILENLAQFRTDDQQQDAGPAGVPPADAEVQFARRYAVNALVDNGTLNGAPVVMELNPTYSNLFGQIENEARFGALTTDFTLIRAGSLHRANGGYLVLPLEELLHNPFSWDSLKRALRNRLLTIENASERVGFPTTRTLQPEPIPLNVKVVLIGQPAMHQLLQAYDEDFDQLFKVRADFASLMDRTDESVRDYAVFVSGVCSAEGLRHLDNLALAKVVEHGSRLAEDQAKLSTRFGEIADVIREADYYAAQDKAPHITDVYIRRAIEQRFYRSSMIQERMQEMTACGALMIDVEGARVGQVNGLSVLDLGDIEFGHPTRITASAGVGREGLIDIERQAMLGGPTHTKGVMILAGYLTEMFARDKPLSLCARLVFEQSYSGVEGDSASSTELYALLSELAGLPIRQGIAVTGSVNQKGEVQAIGGVNEKIEGFYQVCKARGLTGEQGVLIPASNVQNLMLKEEIVEAVRADQFHIWAVKTIDEGIEILTGVEAGARLANGSFAPDTVNGRVDCRLRDSAETLAQFTTKAA